MEKYGFVLDSLTKEGTETLAGNTGITSDEIANFGTKKALVDR
jgi:hypothetical protein